LNINLPSVIFIVSIIAYCYYFGKYIPNTNAMPLIIVGVFGTSLVLLQYGREGNIKLLH
jgi:hypothetical protein